MDSEKDRQGRESRKRDRFGNITISPSNGAEVPRKHSSPKEDSQRTPANGDLDSNAPLRKKRVVKTRRPEPLLLLGGVLTGLAVIVLASSYFFVPVAVKGPLLNYLSDQLGHKVEAGKVSFSPLSLQLHLDSIRMQELSETGETSQPDIERVSISFSLGQLLRGSVGVQTLRLMKPHVEAVRTKDNRIKIEPFGSIGMSNSLGDLHLPGWLHINQLEVADGQLAIRDLNSGKSIQARDVYLILPSRDEEDLLPSFRGIVNGIPLQLASTSRSVDRGVGYYRIQLQGKSTDIAAMIPPELTGEMAVKGVADCSLGLLFPEENLVLKQMRIAGECSIEGLELNESSTKQVLLKAPTSRFKFSGHPAREEFILGQLYLEKAKVSAKSGEKSPVFTMLSDMFRQFAESNKLLAIRRVQIDGGEVEVLRTAGKPESLLSWQGLHLSLSGLHNAAYASRNKVEEQGASVVINGRKGSGVQRATLGFQGQLQPSNVLSGNLTISNLRAGDKSGLIDYADWPEFTKGRVDLSGAVSWDMLNNVQRLSIDSGTFSASGYELKLAEGALLAGEQLVCRGLQKKEAITCDYLDLDDAVLTPLSVSGLKRVVAAPPFSFDVVNLAGGKISIRSTAKDSSSGHSDELLVFNDLSLRFGASRLMVGELKGLNLSAKTGEKGEVRISGQLDAEGSGELQVTGRYLDAGKLQPFLASWLEKAHKINQGNLEVNGKLSLPSGDFSGSARLENTLLGSPHAPPIAWKSLLARGVEYKHGPHSAVVKEVLLQSPVFTPQGEVATGLTSLLSQTLSVDPSRPAEPDISIGRVSIKEGRFSAVNSMVGKGYQPDCQSVDGSIAGISKKGSYTFDLQGECDDGRFNLTGEGVNDQVDEYMLEFDNFPLDAFNNVFTEGLQVESLLATASWRLRYDRGGNGLAGEVRLTGLRPLPESPFTFLLALTTDTENSITVRFDGANTGSLLLVPRVLRKLQQLKIKADIDPGLVLPENYELIDLPHRVAFGLGEAKTEQLTAAMEQMASLQAIRPHLQLVVRGSYDLFDRGHLLEVLQEEENAKRAYENLKREKLREDYLAVDRQDSEKYGEVPSEDVNWFDLPEEVLPLPYREVTIPGGSLEELARQRARGVAQLLTTRLGAEESRVVVDEKTGEDGPWVEISLSPKWGK